MAFPLSSYAWAHTEEAGEAKGRPVVTPAPPTPPPADQRPHAHPPVPSLHVHNAILLEKLLVNPWMNPPPAAEG